MRWLLRIGVLVALSITLWFFGPRAYHVLAARVHLPTQLAASPQVDIERVGLLALPDWLRNRMLEACLGDLAGRLHGSVAIMDEAQAMRARDELLRSPYVAKAHFERVFPDKFRVVISLREPKLEVYEVRAIGTQDAEPIAYLDRDATLLPAAGRLGLPRVASVQKLGPELHGRIAPDPRLVAAVAVAVEWQESVVPLCPRGTPPLREVDAANLGYRMLGDQRFAEVQIGLERSDGKLAWLAYTHPPGSRWPRVGKEVLAEVMTALLGEHPGLADVERADLRFQKRWRERVSRGP